MRPNEEYADEMGISVNIEFKRLRIGSNIITAMSGMQA